MFSEFWNAFSIQKLDIRTDRLRDEDLLSQTCASSPANPDAADGCVLSYYDSPFNEDALSNTLYIDLLAQAVRRAWFYTPYLMPGDALLDALILAAQRGVDVRIIMPGIPDKKLVYRMGRSYYQILLEAGVRIYEYTPGFVHAKACIIDDAVGTIGTVNLDYRSLFLHFENNALFYKCSAIQDLTADFLETLKQCRERTAEDTKTGFWGWFINGLLRIIAPLC